MTLALRTTRSLIIILGGPEVCQLSGRADHVEYRQHLLTRRPPVPTRTPRFDRGRADPRDDRKALQEHSRLYTEAEVRHR